MPTLLFFLRDALVAQRCEFPDDCEVRVGRGGDPGVAVRGEGARWEVRVGSRTLSEEHCVIRVSGGAVTVEDRGSRNGTLLRVAPGERVALDGRSLQLGTELVVREDDARWRLPDAGVTDGRALCAWMNEHLAGTGLRAELAAPEAGTLPLAGEAKHLALRAADGTVDADRAAWARWCAGRFNVAADARIDATTWRFRAVSAERRRVLDEARRAAPSSLPVLLVGPTGVGKEVLAQDLHDHSAQRGGPFVPVNCALLGAERLESALFGHVRGAFTGAHADAAGLVQAAQGGTLFLDEVTEMPIALQASLLRFLESGEYRRVGDATRRHARVRVIAATNADPDDAARLREDLRFRLSGVRLDLPPLAGGDAAVIAGELLRATIARNGRSFADDDVALVVAEVALARWPGGARELRQRIERAVLLSRQGERLIDAWRGARAPDGVATRPSIPAVTDVQPAALARLTSELAFLLAARDAPDRRALATRTHMTWQGADQRLDALGVSLGDAEAIQARTASVMTELRGLLREAPSMADALRALLDG